MNAKLKWTSNADLAIIRNPSVDREEYLDHMTFQANKRPLFTEIFGPLIGLKEEWEIQGATPAELDFSAFKYRCEQKAWVPVITGCFGGQDIVVIEDNAEYKIFKDQLGRTMKLIKQYSTLPLPLDYPVKTMDDWLKIKHLYQFSEERFRPNWLEISKDYLAQGRPLGLRIPGGFDEPRELLGEEMLCFALYDQPELIDDILNTIAETALQIFERVCQHIQVDFLFVHEDMAGKSGPMVGPDAVTRFITPYYLKVWNFLKNKGVRVFDQDSDGNINPIIEAFVEAGVNCMHPMEPAASMDIVQIREKYGNKLAVYGGLDKHVLRQDKTAILKELEYKLPPMIKSGGCVLGLDHRIPNGTPLENYKFYIDKIWEMFNSYNNSN